LKSPHVKKRGLSRAAGAAQFFENKTVQGGFVAKQLVIKHRQGGFVAKQIVIKHRQGGFVAIKHNKHAQ